MQIHITSRGARPVLAGLLGIVLVATACGGDAGGGDAIAELPNSGSESALTNPNEQGQPASEPMSEAGMTRVLEEFRDCMLEELPPGATVDIGLVDGQPQIDVMADSATDADTGRAEETCQPIVAELERSFVGSPDEVAQRKDLALVVQRCMAEEGYDISVSEDGGIGFDTDESEFDEAAYLQAETMCFEQAEAEQE